MSSISSNRTSFRCGLRARLHRAMVGCAAMSIGLLAGMSSLPTHAGVAIPQSPLSLGTPVPGNLALTPSVEWPTIHTQANLGAYDQNRVYIGYFDSKTCYRYSYSANEPDRHFYPVSKTANGRCNGLNAWSGNFLSWAATQTIDPFRFALTGGYRVRDTPTETWLEKARHSPGFGQYPNRSINGGTVGDATPSGFGTFNLRIQDLRNEMYFTDTGNIGAPGATLVEYNPAIHNLSNTPVDRGRVYRVSVRVKVCDPNVGVEPFCKQYSQGWKPEGLIQEYHQKLRYSVFAYLNESGSGRNGGVMRARQKYVGPSTYLPGSPPAANLETEWDPVTGVLIRNPDTADANATGNGVADSGVINYINKFAQMTNRNPKSNDPVSELYYTALRYFKNQGNVPEYSNMTGTAAQRYEMADGFPVITNWDDPMLYACQSNAILGIGDVYTWFDRGLPGGRAGTENVPGAVTADTTVNVETRIAQIFAMEGFPANHTGNLFNGGRANAPYIASLAYDAHTRDIRPNDLPGKQTISTHWVDVREGQQLEGRANNPYWLAAKYGGFKVPVGFDPDVNGATPLDITWWNASNEILTDRSGVQFPRADNFYVASEADKMVAGLRRAFQNIVQEATASGSSLSANSTVLRNGTKIYQAQYVTGRWSGDILAYNVDPVTGNLTQDWRASTNVPAWATRKIFVNSSGYRAFTYGNLNATHAAALGSQQVVDYLRGDRSNETPNGLLLRARSSLIGDIIDSQPIYVGAPNATLYTGKLFNGASAHATYAAAKAARRSVVYVGANDGMLHGFDANTGAETYAFVPSAAIANLRDYTDPDYIHRYYVDGEITVADAYFGGRWRSVLVGTMGRGGRGVFALDVTDPDNVEFLWEKTASDVSAIGNIIGKPIIAQVANGDWRVFVGNGPNGSGDRAQLIMFDLDDGDDVVVDTGEGNDNGMFGVNAWASGLSEFVDTIYAGDLRGNLWKIKDLDSSPTVQRFFNANSGGIVRPITVTPTVAVNPSTAETWVMFGTGSYLTLADQTNRDLQQWFGLVDRGAAIADRSGLEQVDILQQGTSSGTLVRTIETNAAPGADGWFIDLIEPGASDTGERMVVPNIFRGGALIGVTRIPDNTVTDPCNASGATGFIMAVNPFTGGRLDTPPFDINGDGNFDSNDGLNGTPGAGFGLDAGTYSPLLISDRFYLNDQNANITQGRVPFGTQPPIRVSWREIIRN